VAPAGAAAQQLLLPAWLRELGLNDIGDQSDRHALRRFTDLRRRRLGTTRRHSAGSRRALQTGDNVGIQYGLKAAARRCDHAEEFGHAQREDRWQPTPDSNRRAARSVADLPALDIAYKAGIVASGKNLGKLPIIDSRGFDESGIHYIWRSFSSVHASTPRTAATMETR